MPENEDDKSDRVKEPSEEYKNFETVLKQVVSVPKEEMDRRLKADKEARKQKRAK
jgi:hypothetical protein